VDPANPQQVQEGEEAMGNDVQMSPSMLAGLAALAAEGTEPDAADPTPTEQAPPFDPEVANLFGAPDRTTDQGPEQADEPSAPSGRQSWRDATPEDVAADPARALETIRGLQGSTTRAHQERAEMARRQQALEAQENQTQELLLKLASQAQTPAPATSPGGPLLRPEDLVDEDGQVRLDKLLQYNEQQAAAKAAELIRPLQERLTQSETQAQHSAQQERINAFRRDINLMAKVMPALADGDNQMAVAVLMDKTGLDTVAAVKVLFTAEYTQAATAFQQGRQTPNKQAAPTTPGGRRIAAKPALPEDEAGQRREGANRLATGLAELFKSGP
jgi:hypothetical protein